MPGYHHHVLAKSNLMFDNLIGRHPSLSLCKCIRVRQTFGCIRRTHRRVVLLINCKVRSMQIIDHQYPICKRNWLVKEFVRMDFFMLKSYLVKFYDLRLQSFFGYWTHCLQLELSLVSPHAPCCLLSQLFGFGIENLMSRRAILHVRSIGPMI